MASSLPPVKGQAFSFETALVSVSDTDTFQDNPTLAAGDVKVVKDGVLDGNIDTLPTAVTSLTRVLTVALSADEMNADRVTVLFHDAAGDQWQDQVITIYTTAQTLDTTDGVADDVKATVNHVTYGNSAIKAAIPAAAPSAADIKTALEADGSKLDHVWETTENDAGVRRFTANALEQAPTGGTATVAISATTAASVASGALAIRTAHTFAQSITSTSTAALNTATKLWLAIKESDADADTAAIVFLEAAAGLTVLAGATYATTAHGTLVLSGSSGAWTITAGLDEVATGLLTAYAGHTLYAELKALVGTSTVAVWDGTCEVSRGIVQAVS